MTFLLFNPITKNRGKKFFFSVYFSFNTFLLKKKHTLLPSFDMTDNNNITLRVTVFPDNKTIDVDVSLNDRVQHIVDVVKVEFPAYEHGRVRLVYQGKVLQFTSLIGSLDLPNGASIQCVCTKQGGDNDEEQNGAAANPNEAEEVRAGVYAFIDAGIDRESVVGSRLSLLVNGGYLGDAQMRIFNNNNILDGTRGGERASLDQIKDFTRNAMRDAPEPGPRPSPNDRSIESALAYLRPMYAGQEYLDPNSNSGPLIYVSDYSLILLMIEGGFPTLITNALIPLLPEPLSLLYSGELNCEDIEQLKTRLPLPPIPARALQLECLWVGAGAGTGEEGVGITQLGREHDLMGPGTPIVVEDRREYTAFMFMRDFTVGLGLGFFLFAIAAAVMFHSKCRGAMLLGIATGVLVNIIFSFFMSFANLF